LMMYHGVGMHTSGGGTASKVRPVLKFAWTVSTEFVWSLESMLLD
jgi:hypothetical protein